MKYTPTRFMLESSHYDKKKADFAVNFINCLCHTKGRWAGKPFKLMPWQEVIIRDIFGVVKENGKRQFTTAYIEIPKKNGKSELAAAIALLLLYGDGEASPEVYGAAADRQQASIVFDVANAMVQMSPALARRSKPQNANKRIRCLLNNGFYQVLSAEVKTKHGLNVSGLVLDEVHAQPNRNLFDVLTKGSGDAREQPLYFLITTAGNDTHSIGYELHTKAKDIIDGKKFDSSFYPVIYGIDENDDWEDEKTWYKANPSLGETITIDKVRQSYLEAKENIANENAFRQLRLNQWVKQAVRWMPMDKWKNNTVEFTEADLEGKYCYGGLDLSSTSDLTAFVLVFPPQDGLEKFYILPYYWLPEETIPLRVKRDSVPYDIWEQQGLFFTTEGNVIHYQYIEKFIEELNTKFNIKEIAYDRWGATQLSQDLENMGFVVVPFGQGFSSMSAPTKELMRLVLEGSIAHNGHPVLHWNFDNVVVRTDPAGNIKMDKAKSTEKIDGAVATVMALDRAIRNINKNDDSIYDTRDLLFI